MSKEIYLKYWHKSMDCPIQLRILAHKWKKCGLSALKFKDGVTNEMAANMYDEWYSKHEEKRMDQLNDLHDSHEMLTHDEQKVLVQICTLLSACARGLTEGELHDIISAIVCEREDERQRVDPSYRVIYRLLEKYPDLRSKVRASSAIDCLRAAQACSETRDTFFTKLNNYVELLHEMKYVKENNYAELCSSRGGLRRIYNMDEVAVDTTQHRNKVICSKEFAKRCFSVTPEGDGKMNFHVSIALTTRADGKINFFD